MALGGTEDAAPAGSEVPPPPAPPSAPPPPPTPSSDVAFLTAAARVRLAFLATLWSTLTAAVGGGAAAEDEVPDLFLLAGLVALGLGRAHPPPPPARTGRADGFSPCACVL